MSVWQQIVAFALKGLKPSYYWRHFVLGAIVPVIIIGLQIYACFLRIPAFIKLKS